MSLRLCVTLAFAFGLFVVPRADAQSPARVGEAAVVQNEVLRVAGSGASQINVGDGVLRDETVRTGADSAARLVMIDSTNLSLGANASIRLDRTVFNDEHSYKEIAIRLTTGAFRFVTGHSEKTAYKITTPLATIGVRGTTLDILSQNGKSTVVLQDGAAMVGKFDGFGPVADAILYHHERVDGGGYPAGLIGNEIPLASRIVAICSTYDTLTARETYRAPMTPQDAMTEMRRVAGRQLDAELVESFIAMLEREGSLTFVHGDDADFEAELAFERRARQIAAPAAR